MTTDSDNEFFSSIDPARIKQLRAGVPVVNEICADLELLARELKALRDSGCSQKEPVHQQTHESYAALLLELGEHLRRNETDVMTSTHKNQE